MIALWLLLASIVGVSVGFFFGFDCGWHKARSDISKASKA